MMMPTLAVTTAHAFVLTVSHGLLFRRPPFTATALLPPLLSNSPRSIARRTRRPKSALLVSDLDSSPTSRARSIALHRQCRLLSSNILLGARQMTGREPMKFHDLSTI